MLRALAPFLYVASVLGLLAVLSPLGRRVNGAHAWIVLPAGFSLQPSEFVKVALCVGLAMLLADARRRGPAVPGSRRLALGLAAVPIGLIMLQPDLGTMIVMLVIVLGVLAVSGCLRRWILGWCCRHPRRGRHRASGCAATSTRSTGSRPSPTRRSTRRASATTPTRPASPSAPAACTGTGLFQGTQTNGQFVPEQQTDFVFTVAGEELGFVGARAVIALLGVVLWRAAHRLRAEDCSARSSPPASCAGSPSRRSRTSG